VPVFQEQVIPLAMVATGFSGGEADQLRRAMANWGKNGDLIKFRGIREHGHSEDFTEWLFSQMKGFGAYGFT
jgi:error-prone DNA polymerase